jgi:hypothetical protein
MCRRLWFLVRLAHLSHMHIYASLLTRLESCRDTSIAQNHFSHDFALRKHRHYDIAVLERLGVPIRGCRVLPLFCRFLDFTRIDVVYYDTEAVFWQIRGH